MGGYFAMQGDKPPFFFPRVEVVVKTGRGGGGSGVFAILGRLRRKGRVSLLMKLSDLIWGEKKEEVEENEQI